MHTSKPVPTFKRLVKTVSARYLIRHRVRGWMAQYPSVYLPIARRKYDNIIQRTGVLEDYEPYGGRPVGPDTDIVIEGYPRSANSFALVAFQYAQVNPVVMAHHRHVPAQVIAAARLNIPTLVLIRPPDDAVISLMIRQPNMVMKRALHDYARFYSRVIPYRKHFVTATFQEVTLDFGAVTRRLNESFGTDFGVFDHTPANVEACFELIDERTKKNVADKVGTGGIREETVPRPSQARAGLKQELQQELLSDQLAERRARANAVFRDFIA